MFKIYVIGYYDHFNCGDEQYKTAFKILINEYFPPATQFRNLELNFIDCDKIFNTKFEDDDIIIIGGGDVLNDYFLDKIIAAFASRRNKIIGVSVGLPFQSTLIETNKLNIIDYIFVRTQQDIKLFHKYFHPHRVIYLPDLSYLHNHVVLHSNYSIPESIIKAKEHGQTIVCIAPSRHIYNTSNLTCYENMITNLGHFIKFLINFRYHVVLLPMNTNDNNQYENDKLVNNDLMEWIMRNGGRGDRTFITVIEETLSVGETFAILKKTDFCIPMRFHACLFSIYNNVPILPIFTTRKIKNLLLDIGWNSNFSMELETNKNNIPIGIDLSTLISRFVSLTESNTKSEMMNINSLLFSKTFNDNVHVLIDVLTSEYSKMSIQSLKSNFKSEIDAKIDEVYKFVQDFALSKGYSHFMYVSDSVLQDLIVCIVSYNLTNGCIESKYNHGLKEKMFDTSKIYNYREEWKWILNQESEQQMLRTLHNNPHGLFNLSYIDQMDYSGAHRSGWQYVYDSIKYLHNDKSDLLLDLYVDRTFHWGCEVNKILKVIPYTSKWIGVIHHTFDTSFSIYNCVKLLQVPEFIESLKYCKGLIVLSQYLKQELEKQLKSIGQGHIVVHCLTHPTETNVVKFTMEKFIANNDAKLIHVGGWLRNVYTFYNINTQQMEVARPLYMFFKPAKLFFKPAKQITLRKVALKGKNMSNYYPYPSFLSDVYSILKGRESQIRDQNLIQNSSQNSIAFQNTSQHIMQNSSTNASLDMCVTINNNWNRHFYEDISTKLKTVDSLEFQDNNQYDLLLSQNIVFIHLIDASAVNTVIECITRDTPIIVNKHPAIVEMLGEKYPLYYSSTTPQSICEEVCRMLKTTTSIKRAHLYIRKISKTKYEMNNFIENFVKIISKSGK